MRKKKLWLMIVFAAVLLGITGFLYVKSHPGSPRQMPEAGAGNILKFQASKEDLANTVEVKGKSSYVKEISVYAPFSADIVRWEVTDGAQVQAGDPLFRLDDKELRQQIELQEANNRKQELETKLKQVQQAADSKTAQQISDNEAEALKRYAQNTAKDVQEELESVNRKIASTDLASKRSKLSQASFVSPDSGIFLLQSASAPQKVKEDELIGKIVDVSKLQMTTSVGEYDVFRIQPGMQVTVRIDALKQTRLSGKVEKVAKFAKPTENSGSAAQFEIIISLEAHPELIAGLSLTATIETDNKKNVLTVPTLAVFRDKDSYYVHVETSQGFEKRPIKVGLETADKTEVLEGLQEGDTIVLQ